MPSGVWFLGSSPEPATPGLATLGRCVPGERPPQPPPPESSRLAHGLPYPPRSPPGGRIPLATPCPSRLNPGLTKVLRAPKSRFRDSALGPLPLPSLLPVTFGGRHEEGGAGSQAVAPFPASFAQLGARSALTSLGRRPSAHPGLPQPVQAPGPCLSPKRRPARRRQGGVRATPNSLPPGVPRRSGARARPGALA